MRWTDGAGGWGREEKWGGCIYGGQEKQVRMIEYEADTKQTEGVALPRAGGRHRGPGKPRQARLPSVIERSHVFKQHGLGRRGPAARPPPP